MLVVLACVLLAVFAPQIGRRLEEATSPLRQPVRGYYAAVREHDWQRTESYLSGSLRSKEGVGRLRRDWLRRQEAYGRVERFEFTGTDVRVVSGSEQATVTGVLHYSSGQSEQKVIQLVREGGRWRLASLP